MKTIIRMIPVKKISMIFCLGIIISFFSCEDKDEINNRVPPQPKNVTVENIRGGSKIFYEISQVNEIDNITAEFTKSDGYTQILRFNVDSHPDFLTLTGLTADKIEVELYTMDSQGNRSEGIKVEIEPLISMEMQYLNDIIESTTLHSIPEGVTISFSNNEEEKEVVFNLSYKDESGKWVEYVNAPSSKDKKGSLILDELPNSEFNLFVTDKQHNFSSTRSFVVTPIIDVELDKNNFRALRLPGDAEPERSNLDIDNLWDNITQLTVPESKGRWDVKSPAIYPLSFTMDLGEYQNLKLSRIRIFQYGGSRRWMYSMYTPKLIEIYGTSNLPDDGSWDKWTKIAYCESIKPSGRPDGDNTDEDVAAGRAGEIFRFFEPYVPYRFLRFKIIEAYEPSEFCRLEELDIYGVE